MRIIKIFLLLLMATSLYANGQKIYATFNVLPFQKAELSFNTSGRVKSLNVDIGSIVKKGDILATLEANDLLAKLQISKIAIDHAKDEYDRQLSIKNSIGQAKLDKYKFQYDNARAQYKYIKTLINKTILKAPFDGVVTTKNIEIGDSEHAMSSSIALTIETISKQRLKLSFDQKYWNRVHVGDSFEYTVDGDTDKRKDKISIIYPSIDSKIGMMQAVVYTHGLRPGLFGTGNIIINKESE